MRRLSRPERRLDERESSCFSQTSLHFQCDRRRYIRFRFDDGHGCVHLQTWTDDLPAVFAAMALSFTQREYFDLTLSLASDVCRQ